MKHYITSKDKDHLEKIAGCFGRESGSLKVIHNGKLEKRVLEILYL